MAQDLNKMSRDELIKELQQARTEIGNLRNIIMQKQDDARRTHGTTTAPRGGVKSEVLDTRQKYSFSTNVLMIGGNEQHHTIRTISLQDVLSKSYGREDMRDADTPSYFTGQHVALFEGRLSVDQMGTSSVGRPSDGYSVGSFDSPDRLGSSSLASPGLAGERGDWSRNSSEIAGITGGDSSSGSGGVQRGKPPPLALHIPKGKLRLDTDAIVSHQTLHTFSREYAMRPLSPQSSVASSVLNYITDFFARKNGFNHIQSDKEMFGRAFLSLCNEVESVLRDEPRHPTVPSPAYVFGDIHGNMRDLHYFGKNLINFNDFRFTPYNLVFLGDYVDRGEHSIEVVAYLFALKVLSPTRVTLLRGNHEDTLVNGDTRTYGDTSLRGQCHSVFSNLLGEEVWKRANRVFTYLPLTANIDNKIFCTHGGLPRYSGGADNRMELLKSEEFPIMESFFQVPEHEDPKHALFRQVASDVCWSDPADDDRMTNEYGFGNNPRGQGVILFGNKAVDAFLEKYGFEYIFRAHQEKSDGLKLSKNARVMTIFSTSAYVGHSNGAGVVYVGEGKIRLIIKQPDEEET